MNVTNASETVTHSVVRHVAAASSSTVRRFPGVSSFEDNDIANELFFGREEESQTLLHFILAENLVVVYSYSGYGKTSLLKTKIFRKLREKNLCPITVRFNKKELDPLQALVMETDRMQGEKGIEVLHNSPGKVAPGNPLISYFNALEIWSADDKLLTPVLVLDQFEEIFTLPHNQPHRASFFEHLAGLLKECIEGNLNIKIIISLREDFLGHLELMAVNIPSVFANRFRLEAFQRGAARLAIEEPAQKEIPSVAFASPAFAFSEGAVKQILDFLSQKMVEGEWQPSAFIEPVQLQIICSELESRVIRGDIQAGAYGQVVIQPTDYGGIAGLQKMAANFYDQQISAMKKALNLSLNETDAVKELIETGLISGKRRVPMAYDTMVNTQGVKRQAIDFLIASKLLKDESYRSNSLVELSHDTLVDPVLESGERRQVQRVKEQKWKKIRFWGGITLVVLFAGLSVYFVSKWQNEERAKAEQYYHAAQLARQQNPTLAYRIALDGKGKFDDASKLDSLIGELRHSRSGFIVNKFSFKEPLHAAYFARDKKSLVLIGENKKERWSLGDSKSLQATDLAEQFALCRINGEYYSLKFSTDDALDLVRRDSVVASIPMTVLDGVSNEEYTKQFIQQIEQLVGHATTASNPSFRINFLFWEGSSLVHAGDSTLAYMEGNCYLHNTATNEFSVFDTAVDGFVPFATKSSKKNPLYEQDLFASGTANRVNAMVATHDLQQVFLVVGNSVTIISKQNSNTVKNISQRLGVVKQIFISSDDSLLLTTDYSNVARVWKKNGEGVATLQGHKAMITFANFSSNDGQIITGDQNGQVFVWKLAKDVGPSEIVRFSPFDYRVLGLDTAEYNADRLYNMSSFEGLVAAVADYESALPKASGYVGDRSYQAHVARAIEDVQQVYETITLSDSFKELEEDRRIDLLYNYVKLLYQADDYEEFRPGIKKIASKRLDSLTDRLVANYLREAVDLNGFLDSPVMIFLDEVTFHYRERKAYNESNKYLEKQIRLMKNIHMLDSSGEMNVSGEIASGYLNLSFYRLFEKNFTGAVSAADSALRYNPDEIMPYTNKALGFLLQGKSNDAWAIYKMHKDDVMTGYFLDDFEALREEEILPTQDSTINKNVLQIERFLKTGESPPALRK